MVDSTADPRRFQPVPLVPLPYRDRFGAPLPAPTTSFVGREREVAAVGDLLRRAGVHLVTLTGPGGVGKTRLALQVAADLAAEFADGARFVDLSPLVDPSLVLPTIAQALGLRRAVDQPVSEQLAAWLAGRELLLVLDNLERVVDAAPELAGLLAACTAVTILATSRVVLRLSAEHVVPVEPLALPNVSRPRSASDLASVEAVALFVQRAQAAEAGFALTETNAPTVEAIVRHLEGLPLAIELAAARVRSLSPAALLARFSDRLRLLTGGPRDQPERQRTMRDTIAWSHDLLGSAEQTLLRHLSVFVGGCTLEAAEVVAGAGDPAGDDVVEGIGSLLDQSLLQKNESPSGPRYVMLETVRQFALECLQASGDREAIERAHAAWCLAFAEELAPTLVTRSYGSLPAVSLERLAAEQDNLRAALGWATERGEAEIALRLAAALSEFWFARGQLAEGRRWAERALGLPGPAPPAVRARVLIALGEMAIWHGASTGARSPAEEGLVLARALGDVVLEGYALNILSIAANEVGDLDQAEALMTRSAELARTVGDRRWEQSALTTLGVVAQVRGDHERAVALFETALPVALAVGDPGLILHVIANLAGQLRRQGHLRRAAALQREGLATAHVLSHPDQLALMLGDAAALAALVGRAEEGARLLGATAARRAAADIQILSLELGLEMETVRLIRATIGQPAFVAARAAGAGLSLEAAVAEADALLAALAAAPEPTEAAPAVIPGGLTPRELEVLRLLAADRTNLQIGEALFISEHTVRKHVERVLAKLGVESRAGAAVFAVRHGLA